MGPFQTREESEETFDLTLHKELRRKYGNLFRAWKVAIDFTQTNRVSQRELFDCARSHGYTA